MELDNKSFAWNQSTFGKSLDEETDILVYEGTLFPSLDLSSTCDISSDQEPPLDGQTSLKHDKNIENGIQNLEFSAVDIREISLDNEGNLTLKFSDNGQTKTIKIDDFDQFTQKVEGFKLSDGSEINTQALYTELCNDMGVCSIDKPPAGQSLDVALDADNRYELMFDLNQSQNVERSTAENGEEVTLGFDDGAQIKFLTAQDLIDQALSNTTLSQDESQSAQSKFLSALELIEELVAKMEMLQDQQARSNFDDPQVELNVAALENEIASELAGIEPASDVFPDAQIENDTQNASVLNENHAEQSYAMLSAIEGDGIIAPTQALEQAREGDQNSEELAQQLANVEPAAGQDSAPSAPSASGGGYGFQSGFDAQGVIGIDDVGPIDPTQLQYGVEPKQDEYFPEEENEEQLSQIPPELPPEEPKNGVPDIFKAKKTVDETSGIELSTTGNVKFDFGDDGAGEITPSNNFSVSGSATGGILYAAGQEVIISSSGNGYVGKTVSGENVFTLSIDPLLGEFTYTQHKPLDHSNANDHNDALTMEFGVQISDSDGDSATSKIYIRVNDDGPKAVDDIASLKTDGKGDINKTIQGNVLDNDLLSADVDNVISKIAFAGQSIEIFSSLPVSIDGQYGTLNIASNGEYTYTLFDDSALSATSYALDPVAFDVSGTQNILYKNGITVKSAHSDNYDLSWVDTHDGSGIGLDHLSYNDSPKAYGPHEAFDIVFDRPADSVSLTIAEIGSNNNYGRHGVDYVITFEDGTTQSAEQQFVPNEIFDGVFSFTIDASDYNGKTIKEIELGSSYDGAFKKASFLLNNVKANYEEERTIEDNFEYTLRDADGDTSTAILKIDNASGEINACKIDAAPLAKTSQVQKTGDEFYGTPADDVINGTDADDVIDGGEGNDTLFGGEGADSFVMNALNKGIDVIGDFDTNEGDVLDFSSLLTGYDPTQKAIDDFVFAREENGGTIISVDKSGSGDVCNAVDLVALKGVQDVSVGDMIENGNINVF